MNTPDKSFKDLFLDLLYPPLCIHCHNPLPPQLEKICLYCLARLDPLDLIYFRENALTEHFWGRCEILAGMALFGYYPGSVVQNIVQGIKYKNQKRLGVMIGRWMGREMRRSLSFHTLEAIIPVPLHPSKRQTRGYNQSDLLAQGIATVLGLPVLEDGLKRSRKTPSQTRLNRISRWRNMENAFYPTEKIENLSHVLLVDDVVTTGATLEACVLALKHQNNVKVSIAALAIGGL